MLTLKMHGRKWEIFINAIDLFFEHGHENVSMRSIAKVSGMSVSSLYNHFPSKESIIDQIYQFYNDNITDAAPALESILAMIPEKSPHEVLHLAMSYYSEDLQPIMDKIYGIAIMQAHRDSKAYGIIWEQTFECSKKYLRTVLQKMIDAKRIEDLDIDTFLELFVSFGFTTAFRVRFPSALGVSGWKKGLDMLFSLVKEIPNTK